jgi:hypothetical protein
VHRSSRATPRIDAMAARLRASTVLLTAALLLTLAGCGAGAKGDPNAGASTGAGASSATPSSCPQTVMATLGSVLGRVYREGVNSERTASAEHLIEYSRPLREAIEAASSAAARTVAKELIATGHMTNLQVTTSSGRVLVATGGKAIAPLSGSVKNAAGVPIATYRTSVWSDGGFSSEASGIAEGLVALRAGDRSVGGTMTLPPGALPAQGSVTHDGKVYQYASFAGELYPSGSAQIYLLKPLSAIEKLCGATEDDTVVNTLEHVANLIYEAEGGPRTLPQIRRVQTNVPLLEAVAARNPYTTASAVAALLHHHLVRLRVLAGGQVLDDDGGPWVLAPVRAPLRFKGHKIGSIVLSIQDDEGYLRLTHRLAGLDVLMYMNEPGSSKPQLVKNSLGPGVGGLETVPAKGSFTYKGHSFRAFTVHATAFPSGPLTIRVLVPIPYA